MKRKPATAEGIFPRLLLVLLALTLSAAGSPPQPDVIIRRMKAALEPPRPSVREIEITVSDQEGHRAEWLAFEARKRLEHGKRIVLTLVNPPDLRGSGLLVDEPAAGTNAQWVYVPALERTRKIVPVGAFQPFLGTDFTYSDLGFVDLADRSFRLLGVAGEGADRVYLVEETPVKQWYYSRIVHHISAEDYLPRQRDIYSPAGDLWKQQFFADVETIDGVATPLSVRMVDLPNGGTTVLHIREVRYDEDLPDDLFTPKALPTLASRPVWKWSDDAQTRADQSDR